MESEKVRLRIPKFHELEYRKKLLSDEETMSYNIGYGDKDGSGCIEFKEDTWEEWFGRWVNKLPERYYAYIINTDENVPIGEAALRYDYEQKAYCASIVVKAKHRGQGFSEEALRLLIDIAFKELGADKVFDNFPSSRIAAEKVFKRAGFKRVSEEIVELRKEDYLRKRS